MNDIVKGDDGRTYRRRRDGRLEEVFEPKAHARRQLEGITARHGITGLRIVDLAKPDEPAIVITLEKAESAKVMPAVKDVLKARAK